MFCFACGFFVVCCMWVVFFFVCFFVYTRHNITKLRLSSHRLATEVRSHYNIDRSCVYVVADW